MINIAEPINTIRTIIAQSGIIPPADIEWENLKLNPASKSLWAREDYLSAFENRLTSKGLNSGGIYQFSIFTPVNTSDVKAVETGVAIGSLWQPQDTIETANYKTSVNSTKCSFQGKFDDLWYSYIVDIEIRVFEK
jgi:hypothetical protein